MLEIGSYPTSAVNALSVGNDTITYVWPGSNVKVTLYENDLPGTGPAGNWMPVITSRSVVSDFDRKTSAIRVEAKTGCTNFPGFKQCVVWADIDFSGNCDVVDVGFSVTYEKILGLSVGNDTISSLICNGSSAVVLWEHAGFRGSSLFSGAGASLSFVGWPFNDKTSSFVVQSDSAACPIPNGLCGDNGYCERQSAGCGETFGVCKLKPTSCPPTILPGPAGATAGPTRTIASATPRASPGCSDGRLHRSERLPVDAAVTGHQLLPSGHSVVSTAWPAAPASNRPLARTASGRTAGTHLRLLTRGGTDDHRTLLRGRDRPAPPRHQSAGPPQPARRWRSLISSSLRASPACTTPSKGDVRVSARVARSGRAARDARTARSTRASGVAAGYAFRVSFQAAFVAPLFERGRVGAR